MRPLRKQFGNNEVKNGRKLQTTFNRNIFPHHETPTIASPITSKEQVPLNKRKRSVRRSTVHVKCIGSIHHWFIHEEMCPCSAKQACLLALATTGSGTNRGAGQWLRASVPDVGPRYTCAPLPSRLSCVSAKLVQLVPVELFHRREMVGFNLHIQK